MTVFAELDRRAQERFGLVTRAEALALLGRGQTDREVAAGRLVPVHRGVYRCAGSRPSFRQRVLAACLAYDPPAVASHTSAARLWQLGRVATPDVEVVVPRSCAGRRLGVRAHRMALEPHEVSERYGIPVTTPARTLRDLAAVLPPKVLERSLDELIRARTMDRCQLEALLDAHRYGGASTLRRLVADRLAGPSPGDSIWVDRIARWLTGAGLPEPERQYTVVVDDRVCVLDLAYPRQLVAVEFNGWEFHQMRWRVDADHARTTALSLAGWIVVVVTSKHEPDLVVEWVRRALHRADARSGFR